MPPRLPHRLVSGLAHARSRAPQPSHWVRPIANCLPAEFVRDYVSIGKPVLFRGLLSGSEPSYGGGFSGAKWSREQLRRRHGSVELQTGDIPYAAAVGLPSTRMPLAEYTSSVLERRESRSIAFEALRTDDPSSVVYDLVMPRNSVLDPDVTGIGSLRKIHLSLGPQGSGTPMRFSRAAVDLLVRGSRTWLLQAPSEATYSSVHPADATARAPWPWAKETLYACQQEAGDVLFLPDMWARAMLNDAESLGFGVEMETGANEFSIDVLSV